MTPEKYKALINASGGFTKGVKRGDHPQPLSKEDDAALSRAWEKIRFEKAAVKQKTVKKT